LNRRQALEPSAAVLKQIRSITSSSKTLETAMAGKSEVRTTCSAFFVKVRESENHCKRHGRLRIASGLSPLRPELAALAAGRLFLQQLDRLARSEDDFAFESTLRGLTYINRLKHWKAAGRRIEIVYLKMFSPDLALRRIAARVKQGGHNVPRDDVLRRFTRSWNNFVRYYRLLADAWSVYDNSGRTPRVLERSP
jgi:predicted ABC-type ATPase